MKQNEMQLFSINKDITKAETLLADFYQSPTYFEESKEKIFTRTWQLIGKSEDIKNVKPETILEGFVNEPILFTKDKDDKLNCLSNVCTHRGKILVEQNCNLSGIRCGYHGRRFGLNGEFISMPEFEGVKNFPQKTDDLQKIPFTVWNDFIFVSLKPVSLLESFIKEMQVKMADFDFANLKLTSKKTYQVKAHWALYCENYLEGFHIPFVHRSLNQELDYDKYQTELFKFTILQKGFDEVGNLVASYYFIFPNLMFNFYPWGISVNIVKPINKELTKIEYLTYVNDESKLDIGAGADLETVEFEDQKVVESVQKGINSRFYQKGRYSPRMETGTHHFHRLIAEFMQ